MARGAIVRSLVLSCAVLAGHSMVFGQSLADVARQEEARRKSVQASGRIYTNQDLPETLSPPTNAAPPAPAKADAPVANDAGKGAAGGTAEEPAKKKVVNPHRDEKQWKGRALEYRTRLTKLREDVAGYESRLETLRAATQTPVVASEIRVVEQDLLKARMSLQSLETEWARVEKQAQESGAADWIKQ